MAINMALVSWRQEYQAFVVSSNPASDTKTLLKGGGGKGGINKSKKLGFQNIRMLGRSNLNRMIYSVI